MDESLNYFGAAIFWLYILAALYFSAVVVYTIVTIEPSQGQNRDGKNGDSVIFGTLAIISFTTLSVNMLNVLIQSFQLWSARHGVTTRLDLAQIWSWSITSTLFQDFGEAIVADSARYLWAQTALLATLSMCLFMGIEGSWRGVPRLWALFFLSQILPISYAQNLFYVILSRLDETSSRPNIPNSYLLCLTGLYCVCLVIAPFTAGGSWLISVIVAARLLLFSPLWIVESSTTHRPSTMSSWDQMLSNKQAQMIVALAAAGCTAYQSLPLLMGRVSMKEIGDALFSHPAVSALGCDFILCAISYGVWTIRGRAGTSGRFKKS